MQFKTGQLTSSDAQRASNEHYDVENSIMAHVKGMTLAGKKNLLSKMPQHVEDAEDTASK